MVKLLGLLRPVLRGPLSGEVGAEKAWIPSAADAVAGRAVVTVMLSDRFLTLRSLLVGDSEPG